MLEVEDSIGRWRHDLNHHSRSKATPRAQRGDQPGLIPLSLVLADGVLHGLLGLMGIDEMAVPEQSPPCSKALAAGIPSRS